MNNINSLNPAILIIAGYFNGKCSKWYSFDTSDNIGKELNTITLTIGYTQIIDKPTILQTIYLPALNLFLHLILAK